MNIEIVEDVVAAVGISVLGVGRDFAPFDAVAMGRGRGLVETDGVLGGRGGKDEEMVSVF